ncbi:MAG: PAS/PAC sensor signal transduction histidine kinase [uncultured archaeon A07HR67]|nr:MAG: PAS/PAC sensor signal transduction histidine kinase [uncultured archaeon A07HR67]
MNTPDDDRSDGSREDAGTTRGDTNRCLAEQTASHAVFALDEHGQIVSWPAPASELYGYDAEAIIGRHVTELFASEADAKGSGPSENILPDPRDGSIENANWHRRADASVFWGRLTVSPITDEGSQGYAAVSQDTTAQKEYERMLERQNDRLKEFTDILAHDLRNPLTVIEGNLTLYNETGDDEHIATIADTVDRMKRLVEDLLRVARQGDIVTDPVSTDLGDVVETAWQVVEIESDATLHYDPVPPISSDPDRLTELFENLFRNGVQHGGPDVVMRVGPIEGGFYVEDNGDGFSVDPEQVFDHGFSTASDGSGYGLSVVRTIVNAHGWDIVATDADSGGARFEVTGIEFLE